MKKIIEKQKEYFFSGKTRNMDFRVEKLKKLKEVYLRREKDIIEALRKDLGRSAVESYMAEIGAVVEEMNCAIKNLRSWAKPQKVKTPLMSFLAKSYIYLEPYGVSLILGTWNYPFSVTFCPLIGSIAAGNCSVVKPSEVSKNSSKLIAEIIKEVFDEEYVAVVEGGPETARALLDEKFDYIFHTGSVAVGKIIMQAASKNLTPLTLELGGKNPCVIDKQVDMETAVRRIAWGKYVNAGQTCIAPDHIFVPRGMKEHLVSNLKKCLEEFYGSDPISSPDYSRIVNEAHFERLSKLLGKGKIVVGGQTDKEKLYIAPTVIEGVSWEDPIMQEEIFGPILPILEYDDLADVISGINSRPKPLALYFFSKDKEAQERIVSQTSSGGVCINATLFHNLNRNLPFGGVGESGMGSYHGRSSFDAFSYKKSVLNKSFRPEIKMVYPPYGNKLGLIRNIWGIISNF